MAKTAVNIQSARVCAFCKYWWDPCCKYIMPHTQTQWYYDSSVKCRCIKKGVDMPAFSQCSMFRMKIDL